MLAYVFWHWAAAGTAAAEYERRLKRFHEVLRAHAPAGFRESAAYRVAGAPWLPAREAYEDWYAIDDFTALGLLNEAAVSAARREPHDAAAAMAAGGTAGVYRLRAGKLIWPPDVVAHWLSKPSGMRYEQFDESLAGVITPGEVACWQRQMTLGPATEFCLIAPRALTLPAGFTATALRVARVC